MSLGLLGAYISSDSDDSSSEDESKISEDKSKNKKAAFSNPFNNGAAGSDAKTLPRPSFMVEQADVKSELSATIVENSVFKNPFRIKEDQKKAVLERHVEMTVKHEDQRTIDGKKVCWMFRKGRCRFGSKCTFAHDSDVKQKPELTGTTTADSEKNRQNSAATGANLVQPNANHSAHMFENDELDNSEAVIECNKAKKKRPGLSNGIVPSKKAMKFHEKVYNAK